MLRCALHNVLNTIQITYENHSHVQYALLLSNSPTLRHFLPDFNFSDL